ncbi:Wzz/FepE/Etk N-terminal domain-containing protein [Teredinibacter turnerae]|uniref:Wzz/FepE/Etk N-terminal domain-containing protein n=1 Tax=Teredinibacter turnerae TaxID=2426 RepID=UPI000566A409|nr:Wzz/FepE/Etk N-terminal domain-containing protein [Teredinibacter turnerae]
MQKTKSMLASEASPEPLLDYEEVIDIRELIYLVWEGKWILITTIISLGMASFLYAISLQNVYKSDALLAPADDNVGGGIASNLSGQLGGLASLAGVSLGDSVDKTTEAIEVLKSREFVSEFIKKHNILVELMAVKGWDADDDKLYIDPEMYDPVNKKWVRKVRAPKNPEPSKLEMYEEFSTRLNVIQSKKTGFITLSIEHLSPRVAQQWVFWLVEDINEVMKVRDTVEANRSIGYLTAQLEKTSIAEMQNIFYQLIEEQTKTIMLASVRDQYVFRVIDPPIIPEKKSGPNRILLVFLGVFLGGAGGLVIVWARSLLRQKEKH